MEIQYDRKELVQNRHMEIKKKKLMANKRENRVEDKLRVWHKYTHTTVYTIDN